MYAKSKESFAMKRVSVLLFSLIACCFGLVSCSDNDSPQTTDGDTETADGDSETTEEEPVFNRDDYEPVLGWILLDTDRDHISEVLAKAADYGVTQVQLSHDLIMDIEQITEDEQRAQMLREITLEAKGYGLEVVVWAHEFTNNRLSVCFHESDPLWQQRRDTYRKAFEIIPELDGIVLMFGSASPDPWYSFCSCDDPTIDFETCRNDPTGEIDIPALELPPAPQRLKLIIDAVADITEELDKKLYIRTFIHKPSEMEWVREGLIREKDRQFIGMSKPVPQDFQPYYPNNSLIGAVPGHPHVTEFDLAGEYWGQSQILNPEVEYEVYRFRHLWEHQGIGAVCRIERGSHYTINTPNEVNLFAISKLMENPDVSPNEIYQGWFSKQYGIDDTAIAAKLKTVLRLSWEAARKRHYVLGFWAMEKGSELPGEPVTEELESRSTTLYDTGFEETFEELKNPTEETIRKIFQENQEAVDAAITARALFGTIAENLPAEQRDDFIKRLHHQELACKAWKWAEEAIWLTKLYGTTSDRAKCRQWIENAIINLNQTGQTISSELGNVWPGSPSTIASLEGNLRNRFPADEVQPLERGQNSIGRPEITDITATSATVTFETSAAATCLVQWGDIITHTPNATDGETVAATAHSITVNGLRADALHLVKPVCAFGSETLPGGDWYVWTEKE